MPHRFQLRQYAPSEVFKTEFKGWGLRAATDIEAGQLIMEYCGEVVDQHEFTLRSMKYSESNHQHFYFMALSQDEVSHISLSFFRTFLMIKCFFYEQKCSQVSHTGVPFLSSNIFMPGHRRNLQGQCLAFHQSQLQPQCGDSEVDGEWPIESRIFHLV